MPVCSWLKLKEWYHRSILLPYALLLHISGYGANNSSYISRNSLCFPRLNCNYAAHFCILQLIPVLLPFLFQMCLSCDGVILLECYDKILVTAHTSCLLAFLPKRWQKGSFSFTTTSSNLICSKVKSKENRKFVPLSSAPLFPKQCFKAEWGWGGGGSAYTETAAAPTFIFHTLV